MTSQARTLNFAVLYLCICLFDWQNKKYVYDIFPNLTSQKQNTFKRSFFTQQTKRLKFLFFFCFCEDGLILDVTLTDDGTQYYFFRTAACELHSLLARYLHDFQRAARIQYCWIPCNPLAECHHYQWYLPFWTDQKDFK